MLKEFAAKKILDIAFDRLKGLGHSPETRVLANTVDVEDALRHHCSAAANWAQEISFRDLSEPRDLPTTYVELDVFVTPQRLHVADEEQTHKIPFLKVIQDLSRHLVLLGPPGSGKTTSLKRVCLSFMMNDDFTRQFDLPIVVRLREVQSAASNPLLLELASQLGIRFSFLETDDHSYRAAVIERSVASLIDQLNCLLLIDGFDELLPEMRAGVAADLITLSLALQKSVMIVTSRSADFQISLTGSQTYEIAPMTDEQVVAFCREFLGEPSSAKRFLDLLNASTYFDTRINPLNLAHLCAIFERIGGIPEKPRTIYRKLINLGLEEWDQQKPVKRASKYANFEVDRKREFLARLAFDLTTRRGGASFSRGDLYSVYLDDLHERFGLDPSDVEKVVDELETYTGLFRRVGQERYEFSHKSLQEYLTAEYLVGLPKLEPNLRLLCRIPDEIAIAIAISSDSDAFFDIIVRESLLGNLEPWGSHPGQYERSESSEEPEAKADIISEWLEHMIEKFPRHSEFLNSPSGAEFLKSTSGIPVGVEIELSNITKERFAEPVAVRMISEMFVVQFLGRILAERVDFSGSPALGISILQLYTMLWRYEKYESVKRAITALRSFVKDMAATRKALRRLSWYYEPIRSARYKCLVFVLRNDSRIIGPERLLCEEEFIKGD